MYKRITVMVAVALFGLLALLALIITDLYDKDFPQGIGVESSVHLEFNETGKSITEIFALLEKLDTQLNLGLVKVAPDLVNDYDSQVFVSLNDNDMPSEFTSFRGDDMGKLVGKERLANSYPDGFYHVTGEKINLDEFVDILQDDGAKVMRVDASVLDSFLFVLQERGFTTAVLAVFALIISLALFWLSIRARGRALRVLGGCPTIRIQLQDLIGFCSALFISALVVTFISIGYVAIIHGMMYVGIFFKVLVGLEIFVIIISLIAAVIMSATAWPSATMLATRQPAVKSLRSAATVIQVVTFLLVMAAAGPAWTAFKDSSTMADEVAQWKQLADQVSIEFATELDEMDQMEKQIGELVKDAETLEQVALSYTWSKEEQNEIDYGDYSGISIVNERWLDLVTDESQSTTVSVSYKEIPLNLVNSLEEDLEILSRNNFSKEQIAKFQYLRPIEGRRIPTALGGGNGALHFSDDVLIVVLPNIYDNLNDSTLTSMASTNNIMFTGVSATQNLLKRNNLNLEALRDNDMKGQLNVVYIAEDGILRAQFADYVVWLLNLSLLALVIAFTIAAVISALITGILQSRRDFPMRLAGCSWFEILRNRITKGVIVGIILVAIIVFLQGTYAILAVLIVGLYGLLVVPLSHLLAAHWCFNKICKREI